MTQLHSILVLIVLIIWERTCNYLLNTKKELKMPETAAMSKQVILWIEHLALVSTGFLTGACAFYFREIVHMALGEELTKR